jgi:hypothetical protein
MSDISTSTAAPTINVINGVTSNHVQDSVGGVNNGATLLAANQVLDKKRLQELVKEVKKPASHLEFSLIILLWFKG